MANSSNLLALVQEAASETTSHKRLEELAHTSREVARIVAANVCTAPEVLQQLAKSEDDETRKAVASNPNTPTEILFQLGVEFPYELLENPVFSLLLLENPNLFQELPEHTQASLLKLEVIPDTFLQWALTHKRPKTMFAVAMNPKLSKSDLCKLVYEAGTNWLTSRVVNVAKLHVNWMGEMKAGWEEAAFSVIQKHQLVKDDIQHDELEFKLWQIGIIPEAFLAGLHRNTLIQIARNPCVPGHILEALFKNPKTATKKVRAAIANNLNTPIHLLEQLAGDDDAWVRQTVFQNPNTPATIYRLFYEYSSAIQNPDTTGATLSEIAKRDWEYTRTGVASHPNTPPEILMKLAYNKSWKTRAAVAGNPSVPVEVLEILVDDKRLGVCHAVIRNPITPASLLVRMLSNYKFYQRQDIARHPNATPAILELLARDTDCYVRVAVVENPNTPMKLLTYLAQDKDFYVRNHVAGNYRTPETVLAQLADDSEYMVRQYVAYNPKTPVSVLRKLATDEDNNVRCAVAENISTPDDVLALLEQDKVEWVKAKAKKFRQTKLINPLHQDFSTEDNTLVAVNPETPIEVLLELVRTDTYQVHLLSIQNICRRMATSNMSTALLEKCAVFDTIEIQIALARHPNIPESVAAKLVSSQSVRLRRLVAQNPNIIQVAPELVKKLLQDKDEDVRHTVLARLLREKTTNNCLNHPNFYCEFLQEWQAVQNPDASSQVLIELAQSQWIIIREAVALHPKAAMILFAPSIEPKLNTSRSCCKSDGSMTLLEKLALDEHTAVKIAVARNSNSPADVLENLARNYKPNNSIHIAAVKALINYYPRGKLYLKSFINNNFASISNFFVLLHHLAPSDLLAKHGRSSSWLERYAVATNPNTPQQIRQMLAQDANRIVRAAAKALM
ncbi:MAG: HEAT repeat domain-containing protein [Calothrix sp. C42_A2020_038]|nr:HEAT repeat domain-containing protein [Calothrix sp. C42_A2020_038]